MDISKPRHQPGPAGADPVGGVPLGLRARLSLMMFLQSFAWGSWYVTAPNFLGTIGFRATDFGWMYSVGPIAGVISPLFVGLVADRYYASERVLGVVNLIGAGVMMAATVMMHGAASSPVLINFVLFIYMLGLYPTFALVVTLPMRHLADPQRSFPGIRVFATIGWIGAGLTLSLSHWEKSIEMFYLSAAATLAMGLYSFTLPHTPPTQKGETITWRQILGADALVLLRNRSYATFLLCSALVCIPLAFYQQIASRVVEMVGLPIGQTMSYGQMSEVLFMIIMPFFFVRLGVKAMLGIGMLAWVVRYALLAIGGTWQIPWMIVVAIVMHGMCFDFFFVTGQIYTDQLAPPAIRSQAQSLLVLCTLGLGMGIGAQLGGQIEQYFTPPASTAFAAQVQGKAQQIATLDARLAAAPAAQAARINLAIERARREQAAARTAELRAKNWAGIFLWPAGFAALILVIFLLRFQDDRVSRQRMVAEMMAVGGPVA